MKILLTSCFTYLLSVLLLNESSCGSVPDEKESSDTSKVSMKEIIPLAVGNYWVYLDSVWEQGELVFTGNDTVRIISEGTYRNYTTYNFSDGKEWYCTGDTVFQLFPQRTGFKYPTPVFMATEEPAEFNFLFGGDVVIQKTVSKISCTESKWQSSECYEVKDACNSFSIIAYGIGAIREQKRDCFSQYENYSRRLLLSYSFK